MADDQKKTPAQTLRESNLNANIWENARENGVNYNTTFNRSYQDQDGNWQKPNSFGEQDLLKLSNLASRSHDAVRELRERDRAAQREANRTQERSDTRTRTRDRDRER